ncbi:sensor histidine kinase [Microbacterium sediminis]|uniref:histidine kinase n=1 Tax=Microbacterium sediminis TaxID=904291 RepID=A0A1B9NAE7_9MICO|nr:histidine kinase [Microbacterium sediminis]OCG73557.1 hypothetical protein A7J15_07735 [Microbacterium sediminis]QBR73232.1 sensor histidine kinase [Microbacterium sediminis]
MTTPVPAQDSRWSRLLDGGWSTGLFVIGCLWDILCLINVPGAAIVPWEAEAEVTLTDLGVLLFLVVVGAWSTVFFRARMPIAVLIAGGVLLVIGVSYLLALVGAFQALTRWPRRTTAIAGGTAIAVVLFALRESTTDWGMAVPWLFGREHSDPTLLGWALVPWVVAVVALGVLAGLVAFQRTRTDAEASRRRAEREHARADALDEELARQAERARIARDLHDGLGHRLSTAALSASAFEAQVAADPAVNPALAQWARTVREQTHAALNDVRGVVGGLRADSPGGQASPSPTLRDIGALLAGLRAAGHRIEAYVVTEAIDQARQELHTEGYRIAQEALTNATKHAPGAAVSFVLDAAPDRGLRIRVENPIVAAPVPVPSGGFGLVGLRERVQSAGGEVWIGPHEGRFIVDVTLPWSA